MATFGEDLVDGILKVQAPVGRPDPVVRPGEAVQQQRVAPRPMAQPQAQPQTEPAASSGDDPTRTWVGLMQKHGIPQGAWGEHVDHYYKLKSNPEAPLENVPPTMAQDLRAYRQQFPNLGARAPEAAEPASQAGQPRPPAPNQGQPDGAGRFAAPVEPRQQAPTGRSIVDEMLGQPAAPAQARAATSPPANDASKEGWAEWVGKNISGRQDPRFKDLPSANEVLATRPDQASGKRVWSHVIGADDEGMAKTYAKSFGADFVRTERDAHGNPIVVYRDGGKEQRAYVNKPGLDYEDVSRGLIGAIPYVLSGGMAGAALKGAPVLGRMAGQALTMGGTSAATDVAGAATGVAPLDIAHSAKKAGITALFGAGGEAAGAALGALATRRAAKNLVDASGKPSPAFEAAMRDAGIDPATVQLSKKAMEDFAQKFARTGDAKGSFVELGSEEFNIPRTLGELTGNKNQLLREQQYRGGTYGETARTRVEALDTTQGKAIGNALRGEIEPGRPGMAGQIAPERAGQQLRKGEMGANIRANTEAAYDAAKTAESEAWSKVKRVEAKPEALAEIDPHFQAALTKSGHIIDEAVTPQAAKMAQALDTFKAGKAPTKAAGVLPDTAVGDINTMRKRLLGMYQAAAPGEDARAARMLYDTFNDWIPIAAEKAGDYATATAMRTARGISRDVHATFDGQQGTPGARIMANVLKKTDNAEGIVNDLFSVPGKTEIKNGATTALASLKKAYDAHLPADAAKAAWDDIRLAYFDRMIGMKTGEHMTPGRLVTSLKTARENQASLYDSLFDAGERQSLRRLEVAMTGIEKKNPNTSWSAIGAGALMRDVGKAIYGMLGGNSAIGKLVGGGIYNRVDKAWGGFRANQATGNGTGASIPSMPAPSYGGSSGGLSNSYAINALTRRPLEVTVGRRNDDR